METDALKLNLQDYIDDTYNLPFLRKVVEKHGGVPRNICAAHSSDGKLEEYDQTTLDIIHHKPHPKFAKSACIIRPMISVLIHRRHRNIVFDNPCFNSFTVIDTAVYIFWMLASHTDSKSFIRIDGVGEEPWIYYLAYLVRSWDYSQRTLVAFGKWLCLRS